jgi:hypothetical protein
MKIFRDLRFDGAKWWTIRNTDVKFGAAVQHKGTYGGADKSLARPDWKKKLKCRHFSSDAEVIAAAETWLDGQPSEFLFWVACES